MASACLTQQHVQRCLIVLTVTRHRAAAIVPAPPFAATVVATPYPGTSTFRATPFRSAAFTSSCIRPTILRSAFSAAAHGSGARTSATHAAAHRRSPKVLTPNTTATEFRSSTSLATRSRTAATLSASLRAARRLPAGSLHVSAMFTHAFDDAVARLGMIPQELPDAVLHSFAAMPAARACCAAAFRLPVATGLIASALAGPRLSPFGPTTLATLLSQALPRTGPLIHAIIPAAKGPLILPSVGLIGPLVRPVPPVLRYGGTRNQGPNRHQNNLAQPCVHHCRILS